MNNLIVDYDGGVIEAKCVSIYQGYEIRVGIFFDDESGEEQCVEIPIEELNSVEQK